MTENLTLRETAEALGVSVGTVRNLKRRGQLATIWIGRRLRVPAAEVERILREGTGGDNDNGKDGAK